MSTRILRDADGKPQCDMYGEVIRTREHACGKSCPLHKIDLTRIDSQIGESE